MGRRVARAHNQLGWHWWPAPNAIATRPYGPLRPCTQRATCMWGCVEGAKGSVDLTHWPQLVAARRRSSSPARACAGSKSNAAAWSPAPSTSIATGIEHFQKAAVDDPRRQRHRHAAAAAAFRLGAVSERPGQFLRPRRPAADDASVRHRGRPVRRRPRQHARPVGTAHAFSRVLRDRRLARLRARRQVGPAADRRPALDDAQLSVGRGNAIWGTDFHREFASASATRHVGHHRRGLARRREPRRARSGAEGRGRHSRRRRSSIACRRTRTACSQFHLARAKESLEAAGAQRGRHRAAHPRNRLASARHVQDGQRIRPRRSSMPGAGATTCRTCSSSTAASGRPRAA